MCYWEGFGLSVSGCSMVSLSYSTSFPPNIQFYLPHLPKFCLIN